MKELPRLGMVAAIAEPILLIERQPTMLDYIANGYIVNSYTCFFSIALSPLTI